MAQVISRDGTRIGYETHGSGPLLVTVAGATQYRGIDPEGTPGLARQLAGDYTVLIYDRRGRGESTDTWPYEVAREIEDIEALIDANGGSARLFGMSSGAVLALEATAALGSKVKGLVMYEPPIDPERSSESYQSDHRDMAALAAENRGEDMIVNFLFDIMPPEVFEGFRNSPSWPSFAAVGLTIEHDYRVLADARATDDPPRAGCRSLRPFSFSMATPPSPSCGPAPTGSPRASQTPRAGRSLARAMTTTRSLSARRFWPSSPSDRPTKKRPLISRGRYHI